MQHPEHTAWQSQSPLNGTPGSLRASMSEGRILSGSRLCLLSILGRNFFGGVGYLMYMWVLCVCVHTHAHAHAPSMYAWMFLQKCVQAWVHILLPVEVRGWCLLASLHYSLRQGLSLNPELTDQVSLAGRLAPRFPGLHLSSSGILGSLLHPAAFMNSAPIACKASISSTESPRWILWSIPFCFLSYITIHC